MITHESLSIVAYLISLVAMVYFIVEGYLTGKYSILFSSFALFASLGAALITSQLILICAFGAALVSPFYLLLFVIGKLASLGNKGGAESCQQTKKR